MSRLLLAHDVWRARDARSCSDETECQPNPHGLESAQHAYRERISALPVVDRIARAHGVGSHPGNLDVEASEVESDARARIQETPRRLRIVVPDREQHADMPQQGNPVAHRMRDIKRAVQ